MPELTDISLRLEIIKAVHCPDWVDELFGIDECRECSHYHGQVRGADNKWRVVCSFRKKKCT